MNKYINYILVLKNFFENNFYPIDIIWIIIRLASINIRISYHASAAYPIIYDDNRIYIIENDKHPNKIPDLKKYSSYLNDEPIKSIESGLDYRVCLTKNGNIYTWGSNNFGQLGLGDYTDRDFPQRVHLENVDLISCGRYHVIAYSNGKLYGWGLNNYQQLGFSEEAYEIMYPTMINFPGKNILQMGCGAYHTIFLTDDDVIGCGRNSKGQLGMDSGSSHMSLTSINFFKNNKIKVVSVKGGSKHTMFLTSLNDVYVSGSNSHWQFGTRKICVLQRLKLDIDFIKEIDCGDNHCAILTSSGKLYMCGYMCTYAKKEQDHFIEFNNCVPNIKNVKCGKNQTIVMTNDDKIWILENYDHPHPRELIF